MGTLNLNDPVNGTTADASLIVTNNTATKATINGGLDNSNLASNAAIAYSKLNLAASIVNADISASAAISASKLSGYPNNSAKYLAGDGTWTTPAGGGGTTLTTYRKTTSKTVINTTTETDLLNGEVAIGAGVMGASGFARLTMWGDWKQNSGGATAVPRYKLKLGAGPTLILDTSVSGSNNMANSTSRFPWRFVVEILNLGATNSQIVTINGMLGVPDTSAGTNVFTTGEGVAQWAAANPGVAVIVGSNTAAIDTTASMSIQFTIINPTASANVDTVLTGALVEVM